MPPSAASKESAVSSGDLVQLDYDLWSEYGGRTELVDTTHEETAQKAQLPIPEGHAFGPRPHLIGGEYFPAGIETALAAAKIGEEFEREFTPAEAFGERDPKLIELFTMHEIERLPEMRREDAKLELGTILNIRGRRGRVVTLTAARVRVDFNPPFSGRKIRGKFRVLEKIGEANERVRALVELTYGRSKEFHIEVHGDSITLQIPDRSKFDVAWLAAKPRVIDQLRTHLKPKTIRIVEEFVTPVAKKEPSEKTKTPEHPHATKSSGKAAAEEPAAPSKSESTS